MKRMQLTTTFREAYLKKSESLRLKMKNLSAICSKKLLNGFSKSTKRNPNSNLIIWVASNALPKESQHNL